jgi:hypothetical protein
MMMTRLVDLGCGRPLQGCKMYPLNRVCFHIGMTLGLMMMMMRISPFGQLGLWASFQGCETSKHTTADARLGGLSGVASNPYH